MNALQLHKRLALQSMNPNDPNAEAKARSIGYRINGEFVSYRDMVLAMTEKPKAVLKDKDGNIKQENIIV